MKRGLFFFLLLASFGILAQKKNSLPGVSPRNILFDIAWPFARDIISNSEQLNFNDSKWREIELPCDWSIEDLPNQLSESIIGPFHKEGQVWIFTRLSIEVTDWYKQELVTGKTEQDKIVAIYFDSVNTNSDTCVNSHNLGNHPIDYSLFIMT